MVHVVLLGVSYLQAGWKETRLQKAEHQKLSDLLTDKNKEMKELKQSSDNLEETVSMLRQQVQGLFFIYSLYVFIQDVYVKV